MTKQNHNLEPPSDFWVRFWGVRGSYPVPGKRTLHFGGNTPCVEIQAGIHTIILDAGTGIVNLGAALMQRARRSGNVPVVVTILFSHLHHDHTQGLPFFEPAHVATSTLYLLGPRAFGRDLRDNLAHSMHPPLFPLSFHEIVAQKKIQSINETDRIVLGKTATDVRIVSSAVGAANGDDEPGTVSIRVYHSYAHPKNGVHIYRITYGKKSVVYATDTEGHVEPDRRLVDFAHDTDLLIHDAQYLPADYASASAPKHGWGHSTIDMACTIAAQSRAKRLVLFHHDPTYDDAMLWGAEAEAKQRFANACLAYEGLEIYL